MLGIESAALAAWVGAIGAVGAVFWAAIGFVQNLHDTRDDNRRAQARLFDAWLVDIEIESRKTAGVSATFLLTVTVECSNSSGQAMRLVNADLYIGEGEVHSKLGKQLAIGTVPPTHFEPWVLTYDLEVADPPDDLVRMFEKRSAWPESMEVKAVAPRPSAMVSAPDKWHLDGLDLFLFTLEVRFRDDAGRVWQRDRRGRLAMFSGHVEPDSAMKPGERSPGRGERSTPEATSGE